MEPNYWGLQFEGVDLNRWPSLLCLIRHHGLKTVFCEGLTPGELPNFRETVNRSLPDGPPPGYALCAHQGLETKPPYGVPPLANAQIAAAPSAKTGGGIVEAPRQVGLSQRSTRIILEIGDIARSAQKHGAASGAPAEYAAQTNEGVTVVRGGVMSP